MTQSNRYGPTAARQHGRPGREVRPKSTTIDIHAHVAVPEAAAFVQPNRVKPQLRPIGIALNVDMRRLSSIAREEEASVCPRASIHRFQTQFGSRAPYLVRAVRQRRR